MNFEIVKNSYDIVIVGAGMAGICASIQACREGLNVALINDRGCVGGNSSCEIAMSIDGANDNNVFALNSREGGIISEILEEMIYRTSDANRYTLDGIYMDFIIDAGVDLYLNTCIDEVKTDDNKIICVAGTQNTTETRFIFHAPLFVDDTGDGTLGALASAEYMIGREASSTFLEKIAPETADDYVLASTLAFFAYDMGHPVKFIPPNFAFDIESSGVLEYRKIPHDKFHRYYWEYEADGKIDQVKCREGIMKFHRSLVYGIWDYIKNSGEYPEAENFDLGYVSLVPGMREYRRLKGDYIITEGDLVQQHEYEDAVAHGGWTIDLHAIGGFFEKELSNRHIHLKGPYQIPYRCLYSWNVENLFMCGRCISASHVAFGSIRVCATLAAVGQVVGMAAVLSNKYDIMPRDITKQHIKELRQALMREGHLILGGQNDDARDMALGAKVTASSEAKLEVSNQAGYMDIGEGIALSIPYSKNIDEIKLNCVADENTQLEYLIYLQDKQYNYGPDKLFARHHVPVNAGDNSVRLPIQIKNNQGGHFLLVIKKNDKLHFAYADKPPFSTMQFTAIKNKNDQIVDYNTLEKFDILWKRDQRCLLYCVFLKQNVYAPDNITNGYNRAYGKPNLWLSDDDDSVPELTVHFDKNVRLDLVQITFAVDNTVCIYHYGKSLYDNLATNYDIYALEDGVWQIKNEIRDNRKKRNRHNIDTVCSALKFVFKEFEGKNVGVYEVRAEGVCDIGK